MLHPADSRLRRIINLQFCPRLNHASILLLLLCLIISPHLSAEEQGAEIPDSKLETVDDLLRGFSEEELNAAVKAIPRREEEPLKPAHPRLVSVTGKVFHDANGNGQQDEGEPGLADVPVSDGEQIITTDASGDYKFRIRFDDNPHHRFVMMTRPNGYQPTNEFFVRIPYDEPELNYTQDFGLATDQASEKNEFWFMATSDSQFTATSEMIAIAKDYEQVTSAPGGPAFLVTAGDLTSTGTQYEWDMYDFIRKSSHIPVYEGFGGHDGNCTDPRCTVSFEQRIWPPFYSWNYGGVHFIQFVSETPYLRSTAQARQEDWMKADLGSLPPGTPVIAVSHYPLSPDYFDNWKQEGINVIGQIGALACRACGSRQESSSSLRCLARGKDWGAYSRTYRWVHVTPKGITSQLRVAGQYKRLELLTPATESITGKQQLVLLAYDTALLVKKVECRWTSPEGHEATTSLQQQGDWTWYGDFTPQTSGKWKCELVATDVKGDEWKRTKEVNISKGTSPIARVGGDLPWLLAGETPRNVPEGPTGKIKPLWVKHTGSIHVIHNAPVVSQGRVYVSVGNPNAYTPNAGVLCLDAATGSTIWKSESPFGDIRGPVTVHDNVVYAITGESWVVAYDALTGIPRWQKPMTRDYATGRPLGINQAPPLPTSRGLLVTDWQKPQYLIDYQTGEDQLELAGDAGYYSSFPFVANDVMYTVCRGKASALSLKDGSEIWTYEEKARGTSAPIVVDGKFIYNSSNGVRAWDASTAENLWNRSVPNVGNQHAVPVVWDDQLIVNGTNLALLDLQTGEVRETVKCATDAERFQRSRRQAMAGGSIPIVAGDLAWFGHDDTSLRAINKQGEVIYEYRLGTPIKTAPAVTGNLILVHDFAGNMWCFA
ncbi:MAG: PQQ-binding-like beta-propeller repeat protein, partial [Planctomycetaceae bacterium]